MQQTTATSQSSSDVQPYVPRRIRSHGIRQSGDWRLKVYSVVLDGSEPDWGVFEPAIALALDALPSPAKAPGRPALGFLIAHTGRGMWYAVLCWWDRENELPIRLWVAEQDGGPPRWRPARASESVCVWDLDIIWHERQAWVATLLAGGDPRAAEADYLGTVLERQAEG